MSKKIYLLYSLYGKLQPKLYKTLKTVQKYISKSPQYKIKQIDSQIQAEKLFPLYKAQHQRYKINSQKLSAEQKIQSLKKQNEKYPNQLKNIYQNTQKVNQSFNSPNFTLNSRVNNNNSINLSQNKQTNRMPNQIQPKTIQQLLQQRKSLIDLFPQMPKLLHYHSPTPSKCPVYPSLIYTGHFDGCSKFNPGPAAAGYYVFYKQQHLFDGCWPLAYKTNNQAQFLALLYCLVDSYLNGVRRIHIYGDSKLVVNISNKIMRASNVNIVDYAQGIHKMLQLFNYWKLQFVQRKYNTRADKLSNDGLKKKLLVQKGTY